MKGKRKITFLRKFILLRIFSAFLAINFAVVLLGVKTARAGELEELLNRVEKKASTVGFFTCSFRQTRNLAMFSQPVSFQGELAMKRPDQLRWEFTAPMPSTLILNGGKGVKCNPNSPERSFDLDADPIMRLVIKHLWSWMDGRYLKMRQHYTIELAGNESIVLFPKEAAMADAVRQIRVSFDPDNLQPSRVRIFESGGDSTDIFFTNYAFKKEPDAALFTQCRPAQ